MMRKMIWSIALIVIASLSACGTDAVPATAVPQTPSPTADLSTSQPEVPAPSTPATAGLLIGEVLPGIHGVNNQMEFVELYNPGVEPVDLEGWSLWYQLDDGKDEELVFRWTSRSDVPALGHYLLGRSGQDVGALADAEFDVSLFEKRGGLALRDADGTPVDSLVWGEGPQAYRAGDAVAAPEAGASLERLPGGNAGNGQNKGDNEADFRANPEPGPQNSGDLPSPAPAERLALALGLPPTVEPGAELTYSVVIANRTASTRHDLQALFPLPAGFEVISLPQGVTRSEDWLAWSITQLEAGRDEEVVIPLQAPWTYLQERLRGAHVEAGDWPVPGYGPLAQISVEGGAIPIGVAQTLVGQTVTVEGTATMYSGGFFAGTTGTKFYLEDETGGIQVYCPGARDLVEVAVGDRVRASGQIEVYRDSLELVPSAFPEDVLVLATTAVQPEAAVIDLEAANSDRTQLGRLVEVEGLATRIDEYTYSYEVDLSDDEGNVVVVYVEKDAGLTAEPLELDKRYRVTGILELYDGVWQVKPRFQDDFEEVFPPELTLEATVQNNVEPGAVMTYTFAAYNHTDSTLSGVQIEAQPPSRGASVSEVLDGGRMEGGSVIWDVEALEGNGGSATVRYTVLLDGAALGEIASDGAVAVADQWPEPVWTEGLRTFVGWGVPIWAIQGPADRSPYTGQEVATEGIVIGVFPELGGFWIQEARSDDNPATSAGLLVLMDEVDPGLELGDLVRVTGRVREVSGQTLIYAATRAEVQVVSEGNLLPPAVELDPPLDAAEAADYLEALEGMLVQVSEPAVVVGPTTKYGETALVRSEWAIDHVMRGDPTGLLIFVDDGSSATHIDRSSLPFAAQSGDLLGDLAGPLAYTYENYKIEPIQPPRIMPVEHVLPVLAPAGPAEFAIATFNVENLFDFEEPNPDDPPLPSRDEYELDLVKTSNAIVAMGAPEIVALQEVENRDILLDLAAQQALNGYQYEGYLIEGQDSRGIDVGYLVRGDRATVEGATALPAPDGLTSRPPLLITVTVHLASGDQTVKVLNNHFTSMSGGELPTEPRRKAQAQWNVTLMAPILARDPASHIVVLGDLNSFYDSPPLDILREGGLRHVYEHVAPLRPYSYIYEGESETLDHILVTPGLYEHLGRVEALHINADYTLAIPGDPSPSGTSDHDPIVAVFTFD